MILAIYTIFDAGIFVGVILLIVGFTIGYPLLQTVLPLQSMDE